MYVYMPMYCACIHIIHTHTYMCMYMYNVLYMYTCTCTYTYMYNVQLDMYVCIHVDQPIKKPTKLTNDTFTYSYFVLHSVILHIPDISIPIRLYSEVSSPVPILVLLQYKSLVTTKDDKRKQTIH